MQISKTKLAVAMIERRVNFTRLAAMSGVSRATLSYINNGKTCSTAVAGKIAKALDKPVTAIIEEETP